MTRRHRWLSWLAVALITFLVFGIVSYFVIDGIADREVARLHVAMKARDEPMRLIDLRPPDVPADRNAAAAVEALAEQLTEPSESVTAALEALREDPTSDPDEEGLVAWLAENASVAEGWARALDQYQASQFGFDYEDPWASTEPHRLRFLDLARLSTASAWIEGRQGHSDLARSALVDSLKGAPLLWPEPILIALFSRMAIRREAAHVLRALIARGALPKAADLSVTLESIDLAGELRRALHAERCVGNEAFSVILGERQAPVSLQTSLEGDARLIESADGSLLRPFFRLDQARYLRMFQDALMLSAKPWFEAERDWPSLQLDDQPFHALMSSTFAISFDNLHRRSEESRALLDLCWLALQVEEAIAAGRTPASLPELQAGHRGFVDPFTGVPYRYEVNDDGYRISSAGGDELFIGR
ncbi:MAG: hypothetical protein RL885_21475 [Planctomycetota bacterium]